jgi:hypothetical protein
MMENAMKTPKRRTSSSFENLPDAEKERIYREIDREDPWEQIARSKPLTARQRSLVTKAKRKGGRPMLGKHGVKVIAVSVERNLLKRTDTYAESIGLKRSELISKALNSILPKAG